VAGGGDVDLVGLEIVEGFEHQAEGFAAGGAGFREGDFKDGHGAAGENHVVAEGADTGRKELMEVAHFVEDVAKERAEDAFLEHGEEFGIGEHGMSLE
jgi:hypothetical protein